MREAYLEVTYRHGQLLAAYLYLPHATRPKSVRTRRVDPGLIIDFAANGEPLGIEITAPAQATVIAVNRVPRELGCAPVRRIDLAPLRAALVKFSRAALCNVRCCRQGRSGSSQ